MTPKGPALEDTDSESETPLRPGENRGPYVLTEHEKEKLKTIEEHENKRAKKEMEEKAKFEEETAELLAFVMYDDRVT